MAGVAVKVTVLPLGKLALQVPPQLIPAGALVTVPLPLPVLFTCKALVLGGGLNVAVTVWLPFMTTLQGPVPLHAPPQPAKVDPPVAFAVKVTALPAVKFAVQVSAQLLIPAGELLTVPLPAPDFMTVRVAVLGGGLNVAVTV